MTTGPTCSLLDPVAICCWRPSFHPWFHLKWQAQDVLDGRAPSPGDELPAADTLRLCDGLKVV